MRSPPARTRHAVKESEKYLRSRIRSHSRSGSGHGASQEAMGCSVFSYFFQRFSSRSTLSFVGPKAQITLSLATSHVDAVSPNPGGLFTKER